MPNYQNGKIYSIRSRSRPDLIYIGSTTNRLSKRLSQHKTSFNGTSSKQIIALGDSYIELIENYPCNSKEELSRREGQIIRATENFVNRKIEGRTHEEWYQEKGKQHQKRYREKNKEKLKQDKKQYYEANKEKLKQDRKQYYEENKEKIAQQTKQYYEANKEKLKEWREENKEKIAQRKKQYREANKESIQQKIKEKITCECGSVLTKNSKARHIKTKKHQDYINSL